MQLTVHLGNAIYIHGHSNISSKKSDARLGSRQSNINGTILE